MQGSLFALQAALPSATPGQQQAWRGRAREDLSSALTANPGFQWEWGSALQRLQSSERECGWMSVQGADHPFNGRGAQLQYRAIGFLTNLAGSWSPTAG